MNENKYLVSVRLITYNHEPYIKDAMDSIMSQQTDFKVEVVVGDDFSKDRTLEIIKEYKSTENIHLRVLERRVGDEYWKMRQEKGRIYNFINVLENCHGKYIALLDGDDYWIDPLKLQKQADFLESHPEYNFSVGEVGRLIQKTGVIKKYKTVVNCTKDETFGIKDYIKYPFSQTSSFFFRNEDLHFPDWIFKVTGVDQCLMILATKNGKIKYHKERFSIYRNHNKSITQTRQNGLTKADLFFHLDRINECTEFKYKGIIKYRKLLVNILYLRISNNRFVKKMISVLYTLIVRIVFLFR